MNSSDLQNKDSSRCAPAGILTIFGATGDLTRRKLIPAIYDLLVQGLLPDTFAIVGFGRRPQDETEFRKNLSAGIKEFARLDYDEAKVDWLCNRIFYQKGGYGEAEAHLALENRLNEIAAEFGAGGNRLYYLSIPPEEFAPVIENLGEIKKAANKGEADNNGWRRVIVEKPFGQDLPSAQALNSLIARYFTENEVFRIDHYLGKETVQNIMTHRFANILWEPIWNRNYIDHIQLVVAEQVDVGKRAGYYETSGATRDMVVNHMFQVLSLVCMEPPTSLGADDVRDEKLKVLRAIKPMSPEQILDNTIRGQYDGYKDAEGVDPDSKTETYVAMKLEIDNWRWNGVPIYLRHGKSLEKRVSEVVIRWKDTPSVLFNDSEKLKSQMLVMRIQPHDGFALRINAKVPGSNQIKDVRMNFDYARTFGSEPPEAYERLLHDAMIGDGTLFTRRDESEASWGIVDPILAAWKESDQKPFSYEPNSWGPKEADDFIGRDGRRWHRPRLMESVMD
jgi:glucose-6-phosphate 1-dehydrogenase